VSFGTEIGLQDETRVNFSIKTETRRRVWWAIYLWERYVNHYFQMMVLC